MRKLFFAALFTLVLALPLSVMAREIELSPMPINGLGTEGHFYPLLPLLPAEQELINDNGSANYYFPYPGSIVTTITIPYNCWLVRLKDYIAGSTGYITADVFSDSGGWPTWTSLIGGPVNINYSGSETWYEYSFSSPIWFSSGTVTHPGQLYGDPSYNCGICTDTNYSGSGGMFYGYSGTWYGDYTAYYGHTMARLIVNDDVTPPYADTFTPPDGGTGQPNTTIVFHVRDDDVGVDTSTIIFYVDDESKGDVSGTLDIDDSNINDVVCTFTPDDDLPVGDTITCTIPDELADILGNVIDSDIVWHFTVSPYTKLQSTSLGHIKAQYN